MKVEYFIQDLDGAPMRWEHVATDMKIPVTVSSVELIPMALPGEYYLHVHLRSLVAKPTREWRK